MTKYVYDDMGVVQTEGGGVLVTEDGTPVKAEGGVKGGGEKRGGLLKKAKGGTASSRADGIAQRGKTRGTIVMCGGGMYKK